MKSINERTEHIFSKAKKEKARRRKKRIAVLSSICCFCIVMGLVLFIPYDKTPPSLTKYVGTDYYPLIETLSPLTYRPPNANNNFEAWGGDNFLYGSKEQADDIEMEASGTWDTITTTMDPTEAPTTEGSTYEEVTDNQVAGVIEGDRIKRSSTHIFYLSMEALCIYSIEGEDSEMVGYLRLEDQDGYSLETFNSGWEMFLSQDCRTVTILTSAYRKDQKQVYVTLINIDVSDPTAPKETKRTYLSGSYLSSRVVDGDLLLVSEYGVRANPDFTELEEFVPHYGVAGEYHCVDPWNIVIPEDATNARYTVVALIDGETLEEKSSAAFLSYSDHLYVSEKNIYVTRSCNDVTENAEENSKLYEWATEISAMSYENDELRHLGTARVKGSVKDQYSLDEYNGILRVAATTSSYKYYLKETAETNTLGVVEWISNVEWRSDNASLYCIDLSTFEVAASVENFAPDGESVRSARFDKEKAYICTAIEFTDPVYLFDLSDLSNITCKETGQIDGYSSSLVNLGDGFLLGIGYGDNRNTLKIEVYEETADALESVDIYEIDSCWFSEDYKSYYIDRENRLFGLCVKKYINADDYVLVLFDGYKLTEIVCETLGNGEVAPELTRAVCVDDYLYIFSDGYGKSGHVFSVVKVW